jgi:hypothetical protein
MVKIGTHLLEHPVVKACYHCTREERRLTTFTVAMIKKALGLDKST